MLDLGVSNSVTGSALGGVVSFQIRELSPPRLSVINERQRARDR